MPNPSSSLKFGAETIPEKKIELLNLIEMLLKRNLEIGKNTVVIVDEAHLIDDPKTFEELRLLYSYNSFLQIRLIFFLPAITISNYGVWGALGMYFLDPLDKHTINSYAYFDGGGAWHGSEIMSGNFRSSFGMEARLRFWIMSR